MNHYPIGTLVKHRHVFKQTLGIVRAIETFSHHSWHFVEWFSTLEETMEEMWEIISIEEIDND